MNGSKRRKQAWAELYQAHAPINIELEIAEVGLEICRAAMKFEKFCQSSSQVQFNS